MTRNIVGGFSIKRRLLIYSFLTSFLILAVCSKSSFLYPFNDWVDANCFFTVGKGMIQGKVVYRDLFEQKGVLLYFLHGLAYLVSHTTFIGVYFIEVIAGTAYLYYAAKTAALFVDEKWAYVIIPALAALVYSSSSFAHGDSAEELCLPLLMAGFYWLMRFFKDEATLTRGALAASGALAACVLWIKYTMLGWWLGFMIAVFAALLLKKQVRRAFLACVWFLAGMAAATMPWFIYFAVNGALGDWFNAYFTLNVTVYAKTTGLASMFQTAWSQFYTNVSANAVLLISILLGLAGFWGIRRMLPGIWAKVSVFLLPMLLIFGVYGGGRDYPYYFLAVMGMTMLPGMIVLARMVSSMTERLRPSITRTKSDKTAPVPWRRVLAAAGCAVMLAASVGYAYVHYQYKGFMTVDKATLAQTQFAEIINKEDNPTLLNYGFLDGGFYTAAGITPSVKYFCKLNISLAEMTEAQNAAIQNKAVQFVVTRSSGKGGGQDASKLLEQNYELLERVAQEFEHRNFTYSLYRLKDA